MVTTRKCVFCGEDIGPGTGKMTVDISGSVSFYCSSKCHKNADLKRSPRKVKWTKAYRKEKGIRVQHLKDTEAERKSKKEKEEPKKGKEEKDSDKGKKSRKKGKK